MAAGQQKKRLNASSAVSGNLQQYSAKKKKSAETSQSSRVLLGLDEKDIKIVSKREQVGIGWSDLGSFIDSFSKCGLADVVTIPEEILDAEDMTDVLSYEVWETHLSDLERNFLSKFLPQGIDADQLVQGLLSGENFHFGNPFLKWGTSLCSGNFHPDAILRKEQSFKTNKNTYYQELMKYHYDILETLQNWKEIWLTCKDSKVDFPQIITRKGFMKDKHQRPSAVPERRKVGSFSRKEEMTQKLCIRSSDASKYMSYFKISKKQHELVKNIKQSGDGIQSKSLNRVLGDIKSFDVQPIEAYEAEERKKLHKHWLKITTRDLPLAFAHWTERKAQRQQWRMSLDQEVVERSDLVDEEKVLTDSLLEEQKDEVQAYPEVIMAIKDSREDEETSPNSIYHSQPLVRVPSLNGQCELIHMNTGSKNSNQDILECKDASPVPPTVFRSMNPSEDFVEARDLIVSTKESVTSLNVNEPLQRIPSLNSHQGLGHMEMEETKEDIMQPYTAPNLTEVIGSMNSTQNAIKQGVSFTAKDVWPASGMLDPYHDHHTSGRRRFTSAELSLRQPDTFKQHPTGLIDLERDTFESNVEESLFQRRPSNDDTGSGLHINGSDSVLDSYTNYDCNNLPPFPRGEGLLPSYSHDPKRIGIQFLETRNEPLVTGNLHPVHFQGQPQQLLEQRQHPSNRDFYIQQGIHQKNMYTDSGRYSNSNLGHSLFPQVNMQNWAVNPVHVSAPLLSILNEEGLPGKNWLPNEHGVHGVWPGVEISGSSGQCLGNRRDTDESLYSIFSQHNTLQSCSYEPVTTTTEQYLPMRDFVGRSTTGNGDFIQHTGHQLLNLSGNEADFTAIAAPTLNVNANTNTSWMNLAHQSSHIQDPIEKQFLRSWN
ncbi:hypothetical protein MKX01_025898 [Papaver californicum]|nr:hypothetical protein MKX01_025898 [Papaver californicum]